MKKCDSCGASVADGDLYCGGCGRLATPARRMMPIRRHTREPAAPGCPTRLRPPHRGSRVAKTAGAATESPPLVTSRRSRSS